MDFLPFDEERVREALSKPDDQLNDDDLAIRSWMRTWNQTAGDPDMEPDTEAEPDDHG